MSEPTEGSKITFVHERKAPAKRCHYCKQAGHITKDCERYRAHYARKKKGILPKRKQKRGNLSPAQEAKMNSRVTAQVLGLTVAAAQRELAEARSRLTMATAEVSALERLVERLQAGV